VAGVARALETFASQQGEKNLILAKKKANRILPSFFDEKKRL
jgi:hypothetical protein